MEDQENAPPVEAPQDRRTRKPPPVTPKRFTKFFTPRSSINRIVKSSASKAGRQLREITHSGVNIRSNQPARSRSPKKTVIFKGLEDLNNVSITPTMSSKKRKAYASPESLPFESTPCKRTRPEEGQEDHIPSSPPELLEDRYARFADRSASPELRIPPPQLRRLGASNISGRILQRSFGGLSVTGRGRRKDNCTYWQAQTSDFYTSPDDYHPYASPALPYCTTSCNTNSLVAIGDETGSIRLLDTAADSKHGFSSTYLTIQPHINVVMDLAFSSDDSMLATASGDQTARIIDMQTQKVKYVMNSHTASLKQIRFQPENDNVLATSSRDGHIYIWDLRCKGAEIMVTETSRPITITMSNLLTTQHKAYNAAPYNSILAAHADRHLTSDDVPSAARDSGARERANPSSRTGDVSITALAFLNAPGRSHLLLSGSEASTTLRLWDIRNRYSRRGPPTPLSTTQEPESHSRHRHFGITSLLTNSLGSRIYALSRDNTVYAYSAAHLINGHAPELETGFAAKHHRSVLDNRTGLGPIYGFRHAKMYATTFYVKASLRKAKDDKSELLAIGSADGCAVLLPTDESSFPKPEGYTIPSGLPTPLLGHAPNNLPSSPLASSRPALRRQASSNFGLSARMRDTIPIYNVGTALVQGHTRELTDVTWTHGGELVTLGDDYSARLWREGKQAREIRSAKDGRAMRAGWGWAETEEGWDGEDWE